MRLADLYDYNLFEQDSEKDILSTPNDPEAYHQLFIKRMLAVIEFEDIRVNEYEPPKNKRKFLLNLYKTGCLRIKENGINWHSFMEKFCNIEIEDLSDLEQPEIRNYRDYLKQHIEAYRRIDSAVDYRPDSPELIGIERFITENMGSIDYFNFTDLRDELYYLEQNFANYYAQHFIGELELPVVYAFPSVVDKIKAIRHLVNSAYLTTATQNDLKRLLCRWVRQLTNHLIYKLDLSAADFDQEDFMQHFAQAIHYQPQSSSSKAIHYPTAIFSCSQAYLLFHAIAQKANNQTTLSYVYRRMQEEDQLIIPRDYEFRTWYNQQDYPLNLEYTTQTLAKSFSKEREFFLDLLYEQYGLSLEKKET
ncbi:hypothetical protein [Mesonia sp. HuA40]|uniref:hypothetical protein n=1 Tax=Mesonia sp. HuA40 TaxID=2602761 RepID=UPI0011CA4935|nr:hypothetical protein [Mesonia sp. HuA40]TXK71923.1 hypothetical protein FT993_08410 [Mesonia sp. HuA40]